MILIACVQEKKVFNQERVVKIDKKLEYLFQKDDCGNKQKLLQSRSLE